MNRIDKTFQALNKTQTTAMIGYSVIGDPNRNTSLAIIRQMIKNGCDMIELSLPFSDPIALSEDLQKANARALKNHMTTLAAMACIKEIREDTKIPLILNVYYNQVFRYGIEEFIKQASDSGIDGIFIVDLPIEHQHVVKEITKKYNIYVLLSVTSGSLKRIKEIVGKAQGFLYCAARTEELPQFIELLDKETTLPKVISLNQEDIVNFKSENLFVNGIKIEDMIVKEVPRLLETSATLEELGQAIKKMSHLLHQ